MPEIRFTLKAAIVMAMLVAAPFSWADVSVSLKLDRTETLLTDSVVLIISVKGSRERESTPDIAGLGSFDVRSGGTSSRIEFINGKISSGVEYTYYLQPLKAGTFQIGPARVRIDGKIYTSNGAKLSVSQPAAQKGGGARPHFLERRTFK